MFPLTVLNTLFSTPEAIKEFVNNKPELCNDIFEELRERDMITTVWFADNVNEVIIETETLFIHGSDTPVIVLDILGHLRQELTFNMPLAWIENDDIFIDNDVLISKSWIKKSFEDEVGK